MVWLVLACSTWSASVVATSLWAVVRPREAPPTSPATPGSALLIRPCAGPEASLARSLDSTASARHGFPLRVRFAVAGREDAATPFADAACRKFASATRDARVLSTRAVGPNRKADQLARVLASDGGDDPIVIVADSDVDLDGVSLDALVAPLANPRVGAAWAVPYEREPRTLADRASAAVLDASLHSFSLLSSLDPHSLVGKLVAIRSRTLASVGGFGALVEFLGEDVELGRRLHAAGFEVVRSEVLAPSLAHGRSWSQVVRRYARWISVVKGQRTGLLLAYPGLFCATFPIVLLGVLTARVDGFKALIPAALALAMRVVVACVARARVGHGRPGSDLLADLVLADGLLLAAFVTALTSSKLEWRNAPLTLGRDGRLEREAGTERSTDTYRRRRCTKAGD